MKDLLRTLDLTSRDFWLILKLAEHFKAFPRESTTFLQGKTVALYFTKPSTRTRLAFETAITRLGGTPLMLTPHDLQLSRGESIEDTAKVISSMCCALIIRTYKDAEVKSFANAASVPVINALTDMHHPCQSLADMFTLKEFKSELRTCKLAYLGEGNNVAHSLIEAAALMGMNLVVATPPAYKPNLEIIKDAEKIAQETQASISLTSNPYEAVKHADAIYTDTWVSMGNEQPAERERLSIFQPFQVNQELMKQAKPGASFMHCLPCHRGQEVTAEVIDGPQSVIFAQAENRLHTSTALLYALLNKQLIGGKK